MKKWIMTLSGLAAFVLPVVGQEQIGFVFDEPVPIVTAKIATDEVPAVVVKDVNIGFDKDNPLTWARVPFKLKEFGWVYEEGSPSDIQLTNYTVTIKTVTGNDIRAIYNTNGDLVETWAKSKNIPIPRYIMMALGQSQFKDWNVVGDREFTQFFDNKDNPYAQQHFKLTVEKDNLKKKIGFKYEATSGKFQAYVIR